MTSTVNAGDPDQTRDDIATGASTAKRHAPTLTSDQASALAHEYELKPMGVRPSIPVYVRQCWDRRHFVVELSKAREQSENSESRLGQAWRLLNPLLNSAVYFLVFGVIFKGRGTVSNYIAFLVIGVFFFTYTQQAVLGGSRSIVANMTLVRALNFPRALLPISVVVEEFYTLIPAIIVSVVIVLLTHEGISGWWLMLIPALMLQTLFNLGLAMILARMTERVRDVQKLLPFVMRTWLYLSGVVFPIGKLASEHAPWVGFLASFNPAAVYIELARDCLLTSYSVPPITWAYGVFWALITFIGGFIYFWKAEERYGRG